MQNVYIVLGIYTAAVLLVSVVLLFIPLHLMGVITKPFSFKTFGIRKVKRWNSRTDTLGNLFLWISAFLSILYPVIPFSFWIYGLFLLFSWLACASRAVRLTQVHSTDKKLLILFLINMTCGFGLLASMGFFNNFMLWNEGIVWVESLVEGSARRLLWYLNEPNLFAYLLQVILMFLPLMVFWGQFKFMRLENTFKAGNIYFYVVKMIIWSLVFTAISFYGYPLLYKAYNKEAETRLATSMKNLPYAVIGFGDVVNTVEEIKNDTAPANKTEEERAKQEAEQDALQEDAGADEEAENS